MESRIFTWRGGPMTDEDLAHEATSKYGWDDGDHYFEELQETILESLNGQPGVIAHRVDTVGHNHYICVRHGAPDWCAVLRKCEEYWEAL